MYVEAIERLVQEVVFVDESGNPLMYRTPLDAVDFPSYKPLES